MEEQLTLEQLPKSIQDKLSDVIELNSAIKALRLNLEKCRQRRDYIGMARCQHQLQEMKHSIEEEYLRQNAVYRKRVVDFKKNMSDEDQEILSINSNMVILLADMLETSVMNINEVFQIKNQSENSADVYFYGDIVADSWDAWCDEDQYPENVKNLLSGCQDKNLNIYINSGGGSVFAGIAIYNILKRHSGNKTVHVDGLAASIASVIALAGDRVIIPRNAFLMIHKPWSHCTGNANDYRKEAEVLDTVEQSILNIYEEHLLEGVSRRRKANRRLCRFIEV